MKMYMTGGKLQGRVWWKLQSVKWFFFFFLAEFHQCLWHRGCGRWHSGRCACFLYHHWLLLEVCSVTAIRHDEAAATEKVNETCVISLPCVENNKLCNQTSKIKQIYIWIRHVQSIFLLFSSFFNVTPKTLRMIFQALSTRSNFFYFYFFIFYFSVFFHYAKSCELELSAESGLHLLGCLFSFLLEESAAPPDGLL